MLDSIRHGRVLQKAPSGKAELLREIARLAKADEVFAGVSEEALFEGLSCREQSGSTAIGGGIAIPHCHMPGLTRFVGGIVTIPGGVDFDTPDGKPVRVVVFVFAPEGRRNEHVALLASVSRILADGETLSELLSCQTAEELLRRFSGEHSPSQLVEPSKEKSFLQVFVQRERLFMDILEIIVEASVGAVSVLDAKSARTYLDRMPLFAGFWNDDEERFLRVIVAVTDRAMCNELSRRIMSAASGGDRPGSGVLVVAQDLALVVGDIEF